MITVTFENGETIKLNKSFLFGDLAKPENKNRRCVNHMEAANNEQAMYMISSAIYRFITIQKIDQHDFLDELDEALHVHEKMDEDENSNKLNKLFRNPSTKNV